MRTSRQYFLPLVVALAVVLMAVLYSFGALTGSNREFVRQELQKLFGEDASFDELAINVWGGIGFSAKQFRIADHPRFAANPLLQARELRLRVSFMQLLLGRIVVNSLTLYEPDLQIITDEEGLLNLASQKKEIEVFRNLRAAASGKKTPPVAFRVGRLQIKNGRIDFIDRSVKEPAEVQIKNVEMELEGLALSGQTGVRLVAAVTEGLGHDMRIEGKLGPFVNGRAWSQQPIELEMQFDSLQIPMITRAMPFFRNKIPRELDVTGPLSLQAKLSGTLQRPRITEFRLRAPLFGASDYNAILTGTADLAENQPWPEAQLKGKLILDAVNLTSARNVSFLKEALPASLVTDGIISVHSQFEGTWQNLRLGVLVRADKCDIRHGDWLRKPAGSVANIQGRISRQKNGLILHDALLTLGASKLKLSGALEDTPQHRWQVKLHADRSPVAAWGRLISPSSFFPLGGSFEAHLLIKRNFAAVDGGWELEGKLKLNEAEFRHKPTGRKAENVDLDISFLGKHAQVEKASLRVGSSSIVMTGDAVITNEPVLNYLLQSPDLTLADLAVFNQIPIRLKNVTANGQLQILNGAPSLEASISSLEGVAKQALYRNLRANLTWSPTGIRINNLSAQTLEGRLYSDGYWLSGSDADQRFEWASRMESIDIGSLLGQAFPPMRERIKGQLNFNGQFKGTTEGGGTFEETLEGAGETEMQHGLVKGFNLVAQLLPRASGTAESAKLPATLAALVARNDTPFETLQATFTVEHQRLRTHDLFIVTPDYAITAAGWIALDKTTKWNGLLVLSPHVTQELKHAYRNIYLLVDRRGQLALPFRLEGTLPNIRARLDNRALVQNFRRGSPQMPEEPRPGGDKRQEKKSRREWLPDSLKQLLNR